MRPLTTHTKSELLVVAAEILSNTEIAAHNLGGLLTISAAYITLFHQQITLGPSNSLSQHRGLQASGKRTGSLAKAQPPRGLRKGFSARIHSPHMSKGVATAALAAASYTEHSTSPSPRPQ